MSILFDAHNTCEAHCPLIQRLQEVGEDHDAQHAFVNFSLQPLVLFRRDVNSDVL